MRSATCCRKAPPAGSRSSAIRAPDLDRQAERERLIAARLALPSAAHAAASAAICDLVFPRLPLGAGAIVGGYWPIRGEAVCIPLLHRILAAGAQVALPAILGSDLPLEYRPWTAETPMETGRWAIPHPAHGPAVQPTVILIPLVGFDASGHRLGYGGGFYDRTLAALSKRPLTIGLGFEQARLPSIVPEPHDVALDLIVTEAGVSRPS